MSLLPKVDIPEGQSGKWSVDRFVVSQDGARWDALHANIHGSSRFTPEGVYTRLMCKGRGTIMSDTPAEMVEELAKNHEAGGQAILLLNRRGFSPSRICRSCGRIVRMTGRDRRPERGRS